VRKTRLNRRSSKMAMMGRIFPDRESAERRGLFIGEILLPKGPFYA
jgi:hypothetical protein